MHSNVVPLGQFTPATGDFDRHVVEHLQDSPIFREYREAFETATGLPLALRPAGSFNFPLDDSRRLNPFCALLARTNRTCAACLQLQQQVEQDSAAGPCTRECAAGMAESAVPVRVGERVIGYLRTGQVLHEAPAASRVRSVIRSLGAGLPADAVRDLEEAYRRTRVVARKHYESAVSLLSIFAQHLSSLSNQVMVQETTAEAPAIARARAFISEHQHEEITIRDVAKAVHLSSFYFCKLFKQATGLTFTDYLGRVRIEAVKNMLLNPHVRVSEAAYAAGFQSLSQFNRVFRRVVGESPTVYRDRIHKHAA